MVIYIHPKLEGTEIIQSGKYDPKGFSDEHDEEADIFTNPAVFDSVADPERTVRKCSKA